MTVVITLIVAGADTGPFKLCSDVDGFTIAFETSVSKASLLAGYTSTLVPPGTTTIRVVSLGICSDYIDISIEGGCLCCTNHEFVANRGADVTFTFVECGATTPTTYTASDTPATYCVDRSYPIIQIGTEGSYTDTGVCCETTTTTTTVTPTTTTTTTVLL